MGGAAAAVAGSSGHVAAMAMATAADEEVFGPKLLEQILLCSIVQTQFPPAASLSLFLQAKAAAKL